MSLEDCATVSNALDSITSLAELNGFADRLKKPGAKPATDEEWRRITRMKIEFQQRERT